MLIQMVTDGVVQCSACGACACANQPVRTAVCLQDLSRPRRVLLSVLECDFGGRFHGVGAFRFPTRIDCPSELSL